MRIVLIAWHGDLSQGFYAVPADKVEQFLEMFNNMEPPFERSPWVVVARPAFGPSHFLSMEGL